MTVKDILTWGHEQLLFSSNSARLDAEILLTYTLNKPTTFLLTHDDSEIGFWQLRKYKKLIEKRKEGIPVAYLTGNREFYGLDFKVNKNVLVPRPDTEILVESVVSYLRRNNEITKQRNDVLLLDIGTGSACIPISILKNIPDIKAVATEICGSAMKVAKRNIAKHKLKNRINLIKSDLLKGLSVDYFKDHEIILTANLPYIPKQFQVDSSTKYEPDLALYGGEDGLSLCKRLIEQLEELEIRPKAMFFELFEFQIAALCEHMPGYKLKYAKNMTGDARVMMMERRNQIS